MNDSVIDCSENASSIKLDHYEAMVTKLKNRINDCECQLKDYEDNIVCAASASKHDKTNSTYGIDTTGFNTSSDNNDVQILDLIELMNDIDDGGNIIRIQNEELTNAQENLQQQMSILEKMVKLLKLEINLEANDDPVLKENVPLLDCSPKSLESK